MALDLIRSDPPADQVRRITFVPFLPDGRCVLVEGPAGPGLPSGELHAASRSRQGAQSASSVFRSAFLTTGGTRSRSSSARSRCR